jgi:hypothetical protein
MEKYEDVLVVAMSQSLGGWKTRGWTVAVESGPIQKLEMIEVEATLPELKRALQQPSELLLSLMSFQKRQHFELKKKTTLSKSLRL